MYQEESENEVICTLKYNNLISSSECFPEYFDMNYLKTLSFTFWKTFTQ